MAAIVARRFANGRPLVAAGALVPTPASVTGLSSWWDASRMPASGLTTTSVPDKAGSNTMLPSAAVQYMARSAGQWGGLAIPLTAYQGYDVSAFAPLLQPFLDPTVYFPSSAATPFGTGGAITIDLIYTRPNLRQQDVNAVANTWFSNSYMGGTSPLLAIGTTIVLGITNLGTGADSLILFPSSGTPTTVSTTMEHRHTHSIRLRGSHTGGWDVFLDGVKLTSSPVASQLPSSPASAVLSFLGLSGSNNAQCFFHEAYCYPRALTDAECATLETYLGRYTRGARQGAIMMWTSQSSGADTWAGSHAFYEFCRGICYYTGLASFTLFGEGVGDQSNSGITTFRGGHGLLEGSPGNYLLGAITDNPATTPLGVEGTNSQNFIRSLPTFLQADICGTFAQYADNDCGFGWANRTNLLNMIKRYITLARLMPQDGVTRTAANWLVAWGYAHPIGNGGGSEMHRWVIYNLTQDPTMNAVVWAPNMTSVNPDQSGGVPCGWNPITGLFGAGANADGSGSAGDGVHFDQTVDGLRLARNGIAVVAARLLAIGKGPNTLPAGLPAVGAPVVSSITYEGGTITGNSSTPSVLVTVTHDYGGNDLRIPRAATRGIGWVLLDGNVPGTSAQIQANSCVKISPTSMRVTFPSAPTNALASVGLYYNYYTDVNLIPNSGRLGRGNMITDNYSDSSVNFPPAGWDIGTDLGKQFRDDRGLMSTPLGIPCG